MSMGSRFLGGCDTYVVSILTRYFARTGFSTMATDDFKAAFARRTTEDLVRVSAYPDDYLPEAVAAAVAELQRRRVPADELDRLTAHVHAHAAAEGRRAASLRQTAHAVRRVADVFDATSAHADSPSRILLLLVIGNVGTGLYLIATGSFEFFAGRLGAYGFDSAVAFVTGLLNVFIAYLLHRRRPLGLHMSVFGAVAAVPVSVTSLYLSSARGKHGTSLRRWRMNRCWIPYARHHTTITSS